MSNQIMKIRNAELEQDRRNYVIKEVYLEYVQTNPHSRKGAKRRKLLLNALRDWTGQRDEQAALGTAREIIRNDSPEPSALLQDGSIPAARLAPRSSIRSASQVRSIVTNNVGRGKRQ